MLEVVLLLAQLHKLLEGHLAMRKSGWVGRREENKSPPWDELLPGPSLILQPSEQKHWLSTEQHIYAPAPQMLTSDRERKASGTILAIIFS